MRGSVLLLALRMQMLVFLESEAVNLLNFVRRLSFVKLNSKIGR